MNESEATQRVDAQPELMVDDEGSPLPESDALRKLQLRVGVFLGAKIEVKIEDVSGLQLIPLTL